MTNTKDFRWGSMNGRHYCEWWKNPIHPISFDLKKIYEKIYEKNYAPELSLILLSIRSNVEQKKWLHEIRSRLPDIPVWLYPYNGVGLPKYDPEEVRYALVWKHPKGDLKNYPGLRVIFSLGAGVDHIDDDIKNIPFRNIPIVRLQDPSMSKAMAEHTQYWVTGFRRKYHRYKRYQLEKKWQPEEGERVEDFKVGIMGLGEIGKVIANRLVEDGYPVSGWSNRKKNITGIQSYDKNELSQFLMDLRVLVCCLPLTPETYKLIDNNFLEKVPNNLFFINLGRGGVVDDPSLLEALDRGRVEHAALDVFSEEPLLEDNPFWQHKGVSITPHISGPTKAETAAECVVANIKRVERGETPFPLYNPKLKY